MKKTRMLAGLLAGALALSAGSAMAAPGQMGPGGKGRRGPGVQRLMKQLDLTEAQQEKMKALRLETAKKGAQIQADLKVATLELRNLMSQDAPSASDVKARLQAVNQARGQMMENRVTMQLAVKKILTPDQRKKMKELRKQGPAGRRGKWREGRGRRGPRPGPREMPPPQPGS